MELRQLQYALQIAIDKNFSRAAEKLHIAQPSLSQQLSKLEKEIGVLLFQRTTNSVEATHAGTVFVEKAQKILDMVEQLKKEMEDISQMRKGRLVVGSLPITGAHVLPLVLPVFQARYPEIDIVLVEETTFNLEQLTASGKADISLLSLPLIDDALDYEAVIEEEIVLAVPKTHPLARHTADGHGNVIDIAELRDEPFITLKRGQGFRQITLNLCQKGGFTPNIVFESSNIETVQSLVAAGMGIAFVPHMVSRGRWSELAPAYLPLSFRPTRTLVVAYRKGRYLSKAVVAFMETFRDTMNTENAKNRSDN
ncbi:MULTISPECIES: LysR family transcriptional regulator [unclassified Paenibacillus]|uniref:LysR family transcriptional regulator n=1 Tax=unclassified Paenibacillus TaxID=185978 RepID=UPI001AE7700D|nr:MULTISPECIES: LysR family transcriptional regulator [unclassified Paenibacillus]MBP1156225.1 DNA-binding transcriptional LysR family regulator [Paenibacillus sp. PvP091]MBP1168389.1 DNA-binding transcriptional LysR family regulator [Paenibacillus sp. PvR098]MBP2439417.1 DNA-binding transcriptional LysR family regulator [Paenibacillus sp. PvP052]